MTSEYVIAELQLSTRGRAESRIELLLGLDLLERNAQVDRVAATYITNKLMPSSNPTDAFHAALCSVHHVDYLLTWNCRHLANANKAVHLRAINARLGLPTPELTTPYNLSWPERRPS